MDPSRVGVLIPALLGVTGAILSGCLAAFLGWAIRKEWMRRQLYRGTQDFHRMTIRLLELRISVSQGLKEMELVPGADLRRIDLKDRNLEGVDLRNANLEGANLKGTNLQGANLDSANLLGADLREADLRYAMLRGANLDRANLLDANLQGAILSGALVRGADLRGANLFEADLLGTNLGWAKFDDNTVLPDGWGSLVVSRPGEEALPRLVY